MYAAHSSEFFEISVAVQPENTLKDRWVCLKDFLKRCAIFPLALLGKVFKTFLRGFGVCFTALIVLFTLGGYENGRKLFVNRIACFAKDLADWILLPLALLFCLLRILLALLIHPIFYSNS